MHACAAATQAAAAGPAAAAAATPAAQPQAATQQQQQQQLAPSHQNKGVLQRPSAPASSAAAVAAPDTDSAGSANAAQALLSGIGGGMADSPGVSPASPGQVWLLCYASCVCCPTHTQDLAPRCNHNAIPGPVTRLRDLQER